MQFVIVKYAYLRYNDITIERLCFVLLFSALPRREIKRNAKRTFSFNEIES